MQARLGLFSAMTGLSRRSNASGRIVSTSPFAKIGATAQGGPIQLLVIPLEDFYATCGGGADATLPIVRALDRCFLVVRIVGAFTTSGMRWWILVALTTWLCCAPAASAALLHFEADGIAYEANEDTLEIRARYMGRDVLVMPALLDPAVGWRRSGHTWRNTAGDRAVLRVDGPDLSLTITKVADGEASWALPPMQPRDTWIVPDGEGIAFAAGDPFWRNTPGAATFGEERCLGATAPLSMPAWGRISGRVAVTQMLADGLQAELCLRDENGVQGRVTHRFGPGAESVELLFHVGPANPLAPALAYRALLQRRGQFRSFADKPALALSRLYGAPHAYIWGDGRSLAFLDQIRALGVERMLLAYDQSTDPTAGQVRPDYLTRARGLGFLAGPYDLFVAAVPADAPEEYYVNWGPELFPAGCVHDRNGAITRAYAGRGCTLSSEAVRGRSDIAARYAAHQRDGADQVFVDADAGDQLIADFSPDHPMMPARDRDNRLARLGMGIKQFYFVLGSEHVRAWSHGVTHYSHGSAQSHVLWRIAADHQRFGGWGPPGRPGSFFQPIEFTPVEARAMFGAADRVPLFEAAFHDAVVSTDRWEYSLMKVRGLERLRFARALLYGTPTMWSLDQLELTRAGVWLKAAHDDFRIAHGWDAPVALTGFAWLTADRLVQQTTFADGRTIVGNFSDGAWDGLAPDCVRVTRLGQPSTTLCPPDMPPPPRD